MTLEIGFFEKGKVTCNDCNWVGHESELLKEDHPFDHSPCIKIYGCPKCLCAKEDFTSVCDVMGCIKEVTCGWSSNNGYRLTCSFHMEPNK